MPDLSEVLASAFIAFGLVLLAMVTVTVVLGVRLWRKRALLTGPDAPTGAKVVFWGTIVYAVSPLDLLPDPFLLDDIGVLLLGTMLALALARRGSDRRVQADPAPYIVPAQPAHGGIQDVPDWPGHAASAGPQDRARTSSR